MSQLPWNDVATLSRRVVWVVLVGWLGLTLPQMATAEEGVLPLSDAFSQIDHLLPTPNTYRQGNGAPGPAYWQQKVSYTIEATLDDQAKMLKGQEKIKYENNSPNELPFVWIELNANQYTPNADGVLSTTYDPSKSLTVNDLQRLIASATFEGGMNISKVTEVNGKPLHHVINKGLLRVDFPKPVLPGQSYEFIVGWDYKINDVKLLPGRTGLEHMDDGQAIFGLSQWYPRLCAYTDYGGWRVKQFLGRGEFTLEFGDFDVTLNLPADHTAYATGELVNADKVYSAEQLKRWKESDTAKKPVFIVNKEEAEAARKGSTTERKTWKFKAANVRDFAFASSRTFLCDAMGVNLNGKIVRCISLYPSEGMPLWDKYSTHAVAQAIEVYSEVTGIDYPWPHCTAVMGIPPGGMEFPMINFNGPRPEKDGSYTERTKQGLIKVIIHETGHNWFPMIINNDERHWMWLDEGFNTFVQGFAERRWEGKDFSAIGIPRNIVRYITSADSQPIMTAPDNIFDISGNAYQKTATGLTILRETILGREIFDVAFKEYCRRWAFKRPEPADFFRSMEDGAGVDLDWFWRSWFFNNISNDQELVSLKKIEIHSSEPTGDKARHDREEAKLPQDITRERDTEMERRIEKFPELTDFYDTFDPHAVTPKKETDYKKIIDRMKPDEKEAMAYDKPIYQITVRNNGKLPMPVIIKLNFEDGSSEIRRLPAEIWRKSPVEFTTYLLPSKVVTSAMLDPYNETADTNYGNNRFPQEIETRDVPVTVPKKTIENPLHSAMEAEKKTKKKDDDEEESKED
jgi:hypothetical protein